MNDHESTHAVKPRYMTAKQVGKIFKCSERTIYRWADTGKMPPPVKIGGVVRFRTETIEKWEAEGCPVWRDERR